MHTMVVVMLTLYQENDTLVCLTELQVEEFGSIWPLPKVTAPLLQPYYSQLHVISLTFLQTLPHQ